MRRILNRKPSQRELEIQKFLTKEKLEELFSKGYSAKYIATKHFIPEFKTNKNTVLKYARKYGIIETSHTKERHEEIQKYLSKENLEKLFNDGYSANYIAKKHFAPDFVTNNCTVIRYAKKYNIDYISKRKKRLDPNIQKFLTRKNLEKLFFDGYSANYIATKYFAPEFTTTAGTVIEYAKMYNIETHTIKLANNLEHVQKQRKKTNIKKYGCENVSQSELIKHKKIKKAQEVYGVDNVFQSEEIKEKSQATCLKKYGTRFPGSLNKISGHRSKFQKKIEKHLINNNISFESEVYNKFTAYNNFYKKEYSPRVDILINNIKLVIECNGDLWHANPKLYQPDDLIPLYKGYTSARSIWARDYFRKQQIESFGYSIFTIWELDIKELGVNILEELTNYIHQKTSEISRQI